MLCRLGNCIFLPYTFPSVVISFILVSWRAFSFLYVRVCDGESLAKPEGPKPCQKYRKIRPFTEWESKSELCECQTSSLMDSSGSGPASSGKLSGPNGGFIGWQALCWLCPCSSGWKQKLLHNWEEDKVCSLVLWNMFNLGTESVIWSFYVVCPFSPYLCFRRLVHYVCLEHLTAFKNVLITAIGTKPFHPFQSLWELHFSELCITDLISRNSKLFYEVAYPEEFVCCESYKMYD